MCGLSVSSGDVVWSRPLRVRFSFAFRPPYRPTLIGWQRPRAAAFCARVANRRSPCLPCFACLPARRVSRSIFHAARRLRSAAVSCATAFVISNRILPDFLFYPEIRNAGDQKGKVISINSATPDSICEQVCPGGCCPPPHPLPPTAVCGDLLYERPGSRVLKMKDIVLYLFCVGARGYLSSSEGRVGVRSVVGTYD